MRSQTHSDTRNIHATHTQRKRGRRTHVRIAKTPKHLHRSVQAHTHTQTQTHIYKLFHAKFTASMTSAYVTPSLTHYGILVISM